MKSKIKIIDIVDFIGRILILTIMLCLLAISGNSTGLSSARAVSMGGAHMGLARGVYAGLYNPANLGFNNYRQTGVELAGLGAEISNNSFTLDDYNTYTGAVLSEEDKSVILGKIPSEGLKISADVEASAMSMSYGSFVLSINGYAATETNLGKDALDLFLNGNTLNDSFTVEGMYSDAVAYASAGLSYGMSLFKMNQTELSVGATAKYIRGIAYEEVTELTGGIVTLTTGFAGEGTMIARTATGGSGYGFDIGAALKVNENYTVGVTLSNIMSNITWDNETQQHTYHFEFDTLTADDMDNDSIVVSEDETIDIDPFSASLPTVMRVGFANTTGKFIWAVDYIQGFKLAAGSSSKPELAAGIEYKLLSFMPMRVGYSVGGSKGSTVSGGFGLDISAFYIDLAVSNHSFLKFNETKGLHLAVSTGLAF